MNLPKLHSITKKIFVACLGAFLLVFLLLHMSANLCILRNDSGVWYSDFCHFFGSNYVIKVMEIVLMAGILFHVLLTIWLWFTNRQARGSVRYHHASRTKTHTGSKLMIWTGVLILVALFVHFTDFYFVKMGLVDGKYMMKSKDFVEQIQKPEAQQSPALSAALTMAQYAAQSGMSPEEMLEGSIKDLEMQMQMVNADDTNAAQSAAMYQQQLTQMNEMKQHVPLATAMISVMNGEKWVHNLSVDQRDALVEAMPELEVEPDFYFTAREKFHNIWMVLFYLAFFVVLWFHLRHAFASAFQTLGLNNYKYSPAIEFCSIAYAWIICLGFAIVPIVVFFVL